MLHYCEALRTTYFVSTEKLDPERAEELFIAAFKTEPDKTSIDKQRRQVQSYALIDGTNSIVQIEHDRIHIALQCNHSRLGDLLDGSTSVAPSSDETDGWAWHALDAAFDGIARHLSDKAPVRVAAAAIYATVYRENSDRLAYFKQKYASLDFAEKSSHLLFQINNIGPLSGSSDVLINRLRKESEAEIIVRKAGSVTVYHAVRNEFDFSTLDEMEPRSMIDWHPIVLGLVRDIQSTVEEALSC